jgi:Ubiquitin elongating factor core
VNFHPKELLSSILRIYLHLHAGDRDGRFVAAIAADGRSYRPEHFSEAWRIASELGLPAFDANLTNRLQQLADGVQHAALTASADDEARALRDLRLVQSVVPGTDLRDKGVCVSDRHIRMCSATSAPQSSMQSCIRPVRAYVPSASRWR